MSEMAAFIYGIVATAMISNLIYMIVDAKRMKKEAERLDKMGDDILEDIKVGTAYIEVANNLSERLDKVEEKLNIENKEEK
jgi:hypothetical protein